MHFAAFEGDVGATGASRSSTRPRRLDLQLGRRPAHIRARPDGDGTTFVLSHSFDDRYGAPSFATGWELCLAALRSVLTDAPLPRPSAASPGTKSSSKSSASINLS